MNREKQILLGFLGLLCGGFVAILGAKLFIPRPPAGAGPDIDAPSRIAEPQLVVEPPALDAPDDRPHPAAAPSDAPRAPDRYASRSAFATRDEQVAPAAFLDDPTGDAQMESAPPASPPSRPSPPAPSSPDSPPPPPPTDPVAIVDDDSNPAPDSDRGAPSTPAALAPPVRPGDDLLPPAGFAPPGAPAAAASRSDAAPRVAPAPSPLASPLRAPPVAAPRATSAAAPAALRDAHVTAPGDSWWAIAERAYGDGRYYKALYAWNRQVDPGVSLVPGTRLEIPPVGRLEGAWPRLVPAPSAIGSPRGAD